MNRRNQIRFSIILLVFTAMLLQPALKAVHAGEGSSLRQGIADYKAENFEEALGSLIKAFDKEPSSAVTAHYLGLTYKELLKYTEAKTSLEKAIELKPSMTEAYVSLAEVLYGQNLYEEAEKKLDEAKGLGVRSARASYLRGLVYLKAGKEKGAEAAFKKAVSLEPRSEAADLSREALRVDLGKEFLFSFKVGYAFQHDDNATVSGVPTEEEDTRHVLTLNGDYTTELGAMGLKVGYAFYQSLHQDLDYMDMQGHSLLIAPSLDAGRGKAHLVGTLDYYSLDGEKYLKRSGLKPSYSFSAGGTGVNLFVGLTNKDFLNSTDEERDASNVNAGLGLLLPYNKDRSYAKLGYAFDSEDAEGDDWDYTGNMGSLSVVHPFSTVTELDFTGIYYSQDYSNGSGTKRKDKISSVDVTVTHNYRAVLLKLQYSYTSADSNVAAYDYSRNIIGIGVEGNF